MHRYTLSLTCDGVQSRHTSWHCIGNADISYQCILTYKYLYLILVCVYHQHHRLFDVSIVGVQFHQCMRRCGLKCEAFELFAMCLSNCAHGTM